VRAQKPMAVVGPFSEDEAATVRQGFWTRHGASKSVRSDPGCLRKEHFPGFKFNGSTSLGK